MVTIRGVNVFPSAIQGIVESVPGIREYQVDVSESVAMQELSLRVEVDPMHPAADRVLAKHLRDALSLRIPVMVAEAGSLPRFEFKARRWNRTK